MVYSYRVLRKVINSVVIPFHDGIIEGGIGNNFKRFEYFRGQGYQMFYVGVDLEAPNFSLPTGLIHEQGDCFDLSFLSSLFKRYPIKNPIFLTNTALCDSLLNGRYDTQVETVVDALTHSFRKQLHLIPTGKSQFPITTSRIYSPSDNDDNEYYRKFMNFLEECRRRDWREYLLARDILLLEHE